MIPQPSRIPNTRIWSMADLRAHVAQQGEMIVEAHYSHLTGWTARTAPRRAALSRTYLVSDRGERHTVTVSNNGNGLQFEVDGDFASPNLALTLLDTCTHLRLVSERVALPLSNPVTGTVLVQAGVGA
ncbi:hypothetical protein Dcar01_03564 [Deinococcus carri]|uniref:Uncharacterized protein n=1 Tax=Deinococcus carri TaxID=1211323 RepID=A0ABP9WE17_9DEIO